MEYPQSLWYGVLYDPNKKRVQVAGKDLAAKLLIYILGGITGTDGTLLNFTQGFS